MLEGIFIIAYVIVVVIGVSKKPILFNEHKYAAHMLAWQKCFGRIFNQKHILALVSQALALFIAQVGIGILISYYLRRIGYFNSTVICCYYKFGFTFGYLLQNIM